MLPTIAIVGRPNVGKSTLFNRLIGERKAIVHDRPGVTRDRNYAVARREDREVLCIDTGGLDPEPGDDLFDAIRVQVGAAIAESDVVLFVVDRQTGLTPADRLCAQLLRTQVGQGDRARTLVLVVNKCDTPAQADDVGEFWELGLDPLIGVSAEHSRGILDLWEAIDPLLGPPTEEPEIEGEIRIAVIGRPNIGKSTLVNRLLGEERHVVHDAPGTTMDAIDSLLTVGERTYRLVDTAGVRRKSRVDDRLETFAVARAIKTIERCHVSVLMLDGEVGPTDQDARLAALVVDRGRALVIVVNRWDVAQAMEGRNSSVLEDEIQTHLPHATWAPVLYTSALTGKGIHKVLEAVEHVYKEFDRRIPTAELNRFVEYAVTKHTPAQKHHHPVRFHYATQTRVRPPTIVLWANSPDAVQAAYLRYLENQLREEFGFEGTPLRIQVRKKRKPGTGSSSAAVERGHGMIHVLEDRVINKIAAGEVVERPASVVKELVENALDAGAHDLRVELKGGGRSMIRVTDDGEGMDEHDAALSIERHATSKIKDDEDLFRVGTLGFRGEALPSIAAVSRFELVTRTRDRDTATRVMVEGGRLVAVEAAGAPAGTDVVVRSLFFNVPARRKFLRSPGTELGHCLEAIVREALVRPALDIEVRHDGDLLIRAPVVADRATRAADLLGEHGKALVPMSFADRGLDVEALVSPVGVHKANPQGATYLYVNGRYVRDVVLRAAVNDAYRGIVPKGRYPTIVLALALDPAQVDVNVHPAKTEVRFRNPRDVQECVAEGLRAGLERHGIKRPVVVEARYAPPPASSSATPLFERRPLYAARPLAAAPPTARPLSLRDPSAVPAPIADEPVRHENRDLLPVERYRDLTVLGQLAQTYVLCEGGGELVIVDQHAAHERITLHRLKHRPEGRLGSGQQQLAPVIVDLPPASARAVEPHLGALERYGIEIAAFGGTSFAIQQVPEALLGKDLVRLFHDVADDLVNGNSTESANDAIEHLLATMACRSSVKAGQTLSAYEMRSLLQALDGVDFSVCAHGRPVAIRVSVDELERRFHRT